jgi:regulator of sigma E protease
LAETGDTLASTISGISHMFRGMDLGQAVAGPLKITYIVGEVANQGFSRGFSDGITSMLNILGLLSIALFFMNLMPIPALDGGLILLFVIEAVRRKPLQPRTIYRFQFVGVIVIFALFILITMSDVSFFFRK